MKKEIIKTIILLAIITVIAVICVRKLAGGETLAEFRDNKAATEATADDR